MRVSEARCACLSKRVAEAGGVFGPGGGDFGSDDWIGWRRVCLEEGGGRGGGRGSAKFALEGVGGCDERDGSLGTCLFGETGQLIGAGVAGGVSSGSLSDSDSRAEDEVTEDVTIERDLVGEV